MPGKKDMININAIGSLDTPVQIMYVRRIVSCENISNDSPVIDLFPEKETFQGMTIDTTDNKFTFKEITTYQANIAMGTNYINGNGTNTGLNFPGGAGNAKITGTFQATGLVTINNGMNITAGNIQLNDNVISRDGSPLGIKIINVNGDVSMSRNLTLGNNFQCDQALFLGDIQVSTFAIVNSYIRTNDKFNVSGNDGITTTIDFSTYNGVVTLIGGIVTGKT